jgi:hypothetical protein
LETDEFFDCPFLAIRLVVWKVSQEGRDLGREDTEIYYLNKDMKAVSSPL